MCFDSSGTAPLLLEVKQFRNLSRPYQRVGKADPGEKIQVTGAGAKRDHTFSLVAHDGVRFIKLVLLMPNQVSIVKDLRERNKFLLKSGWKGAEVAKLQNAMRAAQEDGHHPDWEMVALMVGNRSVVACKAQWRRMCEMWGSRDRAANVVLQPVPAVAAPTPVEVESALAMAEAAASAAAEAAAEDEFVSSAGEAAWNEIKLMCFEEYSEGSATEPQWTRSFQWDLPTHETRHKAFGFDFRHPPRPLQLALHMFDVRRHLLPDGHTGKRGSLDATMSWTARDCTPKTDPKMTEHYMEKKRRAEEEEALVKSVLG